MERAKTLQPMWQRVGWHVCHCFNTEIKPPLGTLVFDSLISKKLRGGHFDKYGPHNPVLYIMADDNLLKRWWIRSMNKAHTPTSPKSGDFALNTWVFTLARNARIDYLRKNSRTSIRHRLQKTLCAPSVRGCRCAWKWLDPLKARATAKKRSRTLFNKD